MQQFKVLPCPQCHENRLAIGRGVRVKLGGVSQQVCDDCSLSSTKSRVEGRVGRVKRILAEWPMIDLGRARRLIEDAEFYVSDAAKNLPENWREVAGNNRMARQKADTAVQVAQETLIVELSKLTNDKLAQVGHVTTKEQDEAKRKKAQERLDNMERQIRDGLGVAIRYLESSQDNEIPFQDRRTILSDGVTAAIQAYMRSNSYAEEKTDIDQAELARRLATAAAAETESEEGEEPAPTSETPIEAEEVSQVEDEEAAQE